MMLNLLFAALLTAATEAPDAGLTGAWQHAGEEGAVSTLIVDERHFAIATYRRDPAKFLSTRGGGWERTGEGLRVSYEFDTATPERVGTSETLPIRIEGGRLHAFGVAWSRIDDGTPGALRGAWLMTGRKRDGEITTRRPGARRTMKILSGTRFQWIAYNVETKEFFGSGGGTYTTTDGRYTENIEFFSRDDARTGRSLEFTYELRDGTWHHIGKSTSGEPMHEVWNRRETLGI
jgi:hypothetical protein